MIKKYLIKKNYLKLFLILSFICCWVSISTSTIDLYKIFYILNFNSIYSNSSVENLIPTFNEIINSLRQLPMFIIFPILLILNFLKIDFKNLKYKLPFLCLFFYFILQFPGLVFTENSYFNIGYIISSLNILLILNLSDYLFNKRSLKIFVLLCLFFLILINFLNKDVYLNFFETKVGHSFYTYVDKSSDIFFGKSSPRSTGTARSLLLIYLISLLVFKDFFNNNKKINLIFYSIIATLILFFQSRTVVVLLLIFITFNYFYEKPKNILIYVFNYIIVPFLLLYLSIFIQNHELISSSVNINNTSYLDTLNENLVRPVDPSTYSSGRYSDWMEIISKMQQSIYLGFGSQADRFLIDQSVSNGLLYALSSSGIIGSILYCIFIFSCLLKIFEYLILKLRQSSHENIISSVIILILLLRSLLETSFAVFGVDLIIISSFYTYFKKEDTRTEHAN